MKRKAGKDTWASVTRGILEAIVVLQTINVDRTCATWIRVCDENLPQLMLRMTILKRPITGLSSLSIIR